ncbi:MAG: peptidylprolyl isomerase [Planctomycetes bacterium]|nr:peptidylprolyl isomerase [Planctomycetota bacterium]
MARLLKLLAATGLALLPTASLHAQEHADPLLLEVDGRAFHLDEVLSFYLERHNGHLSLMASRSALESLLDRVKDFYLLVACAKSEGLEEDPIVLSKVQEFTLDKARNTWFVDQTSNQVVVERAQVEEYGDRLLQLYEVREVETISEAQGRRAEASLAEGMEFAEVAARFSMRPSRVKGGLRDPMRIDEMPWALADWIATAEVGDRSPLITHSRGFTLVELISVTEEAPPENRLADTRLMSLLFDIERERRILGLRQQMREAAGARLTVEIDPAWFLEGGGGDGAMVVATAEGIEPVSLQDVRDSLSLPPPLLADPELVQEVAGFAALGQVDERLQNKAAQAAGYADRPEVVRGAQALREDLLVKALKATLIFEDLEIPIEDLLRIYEENRADYDLPPTAELKHILVAEEAECRAAAAALAAGGDWDQIAKDQSIDGSTSQIGGYVGWISPNSILPELDAVIWDLEPGAISEAIQTQAGWHLVTVLRRQAGRATSFPAVQNKILEKEIQRRRMAEVAHWTNLLQERVPWSVHEENFATAMVEIQRRVSEKDTPDPPAEPVF